MRPLNAEELLEVSPKVITSTFSARLFSIQNSMVGGIVDWKIPLSKDQTLMNNILIYFKQRNGVWRILCYECSIVPISFIAL